MASRIPLVCASLAGLLLAATVRASPDHAARSEAPSPSRSKKGSLSRSLGYPWRGHLTNGVRLEESDLIRHSVADQEDDRFWGTQELVGLLERAVDRVSSALPSGPLVVGELSQRRGGDVIGHKSHENGRDVDLGFYLRTEAGQPVPATQFVSIWRSGRGRMGDEGVYFDAQRNWLLIRALLTDRKVQVHHVFTSKWIRRRLLREARRQGTGERLYKRAQQMIIPPDVRHPHHNHFHVRIYCPPDDVPGCRDRGPFWPWLSPDHPFADLAAQQFPDRFPEPRFPEPRF
jgi:penicillin-insensitive murein endopeptidase